mmetsp:Transcript_18214/g.36819  ORF Transcript_18214/g.36819 Transcript_18214/m.36819 type:complete len:220 (-) Transcript_18214:807-1466(-)
MARDMVVCMVTRLVLDCVSACRAVIPRMSSLGVSAGAGAFAIGVGPGTVSRDSSIVVTVIAIVVSCSTAWSRSCSVSVVTPRFVPSVTPTPRFIAVVWWRGLRSRCSFAEHQMSDHVQSQVLLLAPPSAVTDSLEDRAARVECHEGLVPGDPKSPISPFVVSPLQSRGTISGLPPPISDPRVAYVCDVSYSLHVHNEVIWCISFESEGFPADVESSLSS